MDEMDSLRKQNESGQEEKPWAGKKKYKVQPSSYTLSKHLELS